MLIKKHQMNKTNSIWGHAIEKSDNVLLTLQRCKLTAEEKR